MTGREPEWSAGGVEQAEDPAISRPGSTEPGSGWGAKRGQRGAAGGWFGLGHGRDERTS